MSDLPTASPPREAKEKTSDDVIVTFDGPDDPYCALNWSRGKKSKTTVCYALMTACASWSTAIFASATPRIAQEYHVGDTTATLGTSLFLFGLGLGPLLWAPISEVYGRRIAALPSFFIGAVFTFGTATAKDIQTIMITRFFAAFFASAPLVNTGGVLADLYQPKDRTIAMIGYQLSVVGAPLLAPIIGAAMIENDVCWRWLEFMTGIMMLSVLVLNTLLIEETHANTLLAYKARRLRLESGNWALHAKHEEWNATAAELATKYLVRPFQIAVTPIAFVINLYLSFIYTIVYIILTSFPLFFLKERGWSPLNSSLPLLGGLVGCFTGAFICLFCSSFYEKRLVANNNKPVPEARLLPMMIGAPLLAAALFLFGWTSSKNLSAAGPIIGIFLLGSGGLAIFQSCINYLVDTFRVYSASAIASNTVMRCFMAGAFPLFVRAMFEALGVDWGCSLLGFFAVAMIPVPFLFYVYGRRIRANGRWSRASTQ